MEMVTHRWKVGQVDVTVEMPDTLRRVDVDVHVFPEGTEEGIDAIQALHPESVRPSKDLGTVRVERDPEADVSFTVLVYAPSEYSAYDGTSHPWRNRVLEALPELPEKAA